MHAHAVLFQCFLNLNHRGFCDGMKYFTITKISRTMISRELFSIRVETNLQTMEMTSWWRNLLSFFLVLAILRETSMEMDVNENFQCHFEKKQTNTQVNSNFPWSVLLSTIDLEMTSKCSKLCGGTTSRHNIALAILRETSTEMDVKTFNVIVKKQKQNQNKQTNQQQFSMDCTLIDHRNDVQMFKTLRWNH